MDRREFVKMLGAGGLLVGLGALVGMGCAEEEESPEPMMDPEMPPPEAGGPPPEGGDAPPAEGGGEDVPEGEEQNPPAEAE
ncbi:MAG: twin-arginine translocation signal domain-containing protein [Armatimonadia bacterium]|nr:twin-arginine translocation signal domain-containing protein [Armatimonadia bacterium]